MNYILVSREDLCFTAVMFCNPESDLPDGQSAPRQKHDSGWVLKIEYSSRLPLYKHILINKYL